jgi:hypothetical protein
MNLFDVARLIDDHENHCIKTKMKTPNYNGYSLEQYAARTDGPSLPWIHPIMGLVKRDPTMALQRYDTYNLLRAFCYWLSCVRLPSMGDIVAMCHDYSDCVETFVNTVPDEEFVRCSALLYQRVHAYFMQRLPDLVANLCEQNSGIQEEIFDDVHKLTSVYLRARYCSIAVLYDGVNSTLDYIRSGDAIVYGPLVFMIEEVPELQMCSRNRGNLIYASGGVDDYSGTMEESSVDMHYNAFTTMWYFYNCSTVRILANPNQDRVPTYSRLIAILAWKWIYLSIVAPMFITRAAGHDTEQRIRTIFTLSPFQKCTHPLPIAKMYPLALLRHFTDMLSLRSQTAIESFESPIPQNGFNNIACMVYFPYISETIESDFREIPREIIYQRKIALEHPTIWTPPPPPKPKNNPTRVPHRKKLTADERVVMHEKNTTIPIYLRDDRRGYYSIYIRTKNIVILLFSTLQSYISVESCRANQIERRANERLLAPTDDKKLQKQQEKMFSRLYNSNTFVHVERSFIMRCNHNWFRLHHKDLYLFQDCSRVSLLLDKIELYIKNSRKITHSRIDTILKMQLCLRTNKRLLLHAKRVRTREAGDNDTNDELFERNFTNDGDDDDDEDKDEDEDEVDCIEWDPPMTPSPPKTINRRR